MTDFTIMPPNPSEFVELSRSKTGRVFRKQILPYGDFYYDTVKGGKVRVDEKMADALISNFNNKVADIVQVPKVNDKNQHTEDPDMNLGEVVNLTKGRGGLYADIDVRDDKAAEKIAKKLYLGASAMMSLDYEDTRTGQKAGPTLLHVAITNRPHIVGLEEFEEIIAASANGADSTNQAVLLTAPNPKDKKMTLDEMLAELKADHGIDVPELQQKAESADEAVALSSRIQEELVGGGLLTLSNAGTATNDDLIKAVTDAGSKIVELSGQISTMREESARAEAETAVKGLVGEGKILPANETGMVELYLSNKSLFDQLVPEKPLVELSRGEAGFEHVASSTPEATVNAEIERLTGVAKTKAFIRE